LKSYDTHNNFSEATTEFIVASNEKLALQYVLNYPNPFNSNTTFHFDHNKAGEYLTVFIYVYTVSGKLAKTLTTQITTSTSHFDQLTWNGLDEYGDKLANGVYIYKVQVKSGTGKTAEATQKLVILN
jgi:flagellar hook assembly protein FlgD